MSVDIDGKRGSKKTSRVWLVALPVAVLLGGFGVWTFTQGSKPTANGTDGVTADTASSAKLAKVAVQAGDLPKGFRKCTFSGPFLAHNEKLEKTRPESYSANLALWDILRKQGATDAYVAYWGDSAEACNTVVGGEQGMAPHEPGKAHPSVVLSLVVGYTNPDAAAASYKSDVFGQSAFKGDTNFEVTQGEATGLGPNSDSRIQPKAAVPRHEAIWQTRAVMVRFGSENLTPTQSSAVTSAINRRIP